MKKLKKICIITQRYPTDTDPAYTFVDKLVCEIADQGIDCTVISPYSISAKMVRNREEMPKYRERVTNKHNIVKIYHPRYVSFSNKNIIGLNTGILTLNSFQFAVEKTLDKLEDEFDAIYGHFIMPSGIVANNVGKKRGIPSFLAYGECSIDQFDFIGLDRVRNGLKNIKGVISVSTANKEILISNKIIDKNIIEVFPNAIDTEIFYKRNKDDIRSQLGINKDEFIAIFVGSFIERKGPLRVMDALDNTGIKLIFIGNGSQKPEGKNILICGKVEHSKIPELLSAADIFVLPTLAEGCCNAIIEAMSCGLPIVSSNLPFNKDILNERNSIMVNPLDINSIKHAVLRIKENKELIEKMGKESLKIANDLNIENRAKKIIDFIESKI
ncbi:MAG: glycosyltransferase family 4 protein [Paraclostridium sordellii]